MENYDAGAGGIKRVRSFVIGSVSWISGGLGRGLFFLHNYIVPW